MDEQPRDAEQPPPATYRQIEADLRHRVGSGTWQAGEMIPGRRELARVYGVSPITVERAIAPLLAEGLLRADGRRGTFVAHQDSAVSAAGPSHGVSADRTGAVVLDRRPARVVTGRATVGVIASLYVFNSDHLELNNYWVRLLVGSIEQSLSREGHVTAFYNRVQSPGLPPLPLRDAIRRAVADGVDALVIIGLGLSPDEVTDGLDALGPTGVPVVCATPDPLNRPVPNVCLDNPIAGYRAAETLIAAGCRNVVFIAPFQASWSEDRLAGARAAAAHARMPATSLEAFPLSAKVWQQEEDPEVPGYSAACDYLRSGGRADGVICANDGVAFGFLRAAAENGLQPGSDFAIVGFDDHPRARLLQLTSLRPPMEEMGEEASRLVMLSLRGRRDSIQVRLPWHLIPRASSETPAKAASVGSAQREGVILGG